jgi:hypothetical protein
MQVQPDDSDAPHVIMPGAKRFPAPANMSPAERKHWTDFMQALPAGWFGRETLPLLRLLCRYLVVSDAALTCISNATADNAIDQRLIQKQMVVADKAADMVVKCMYQLRLTPKSRREVSRKVDETNRTANPIRPWEMEIGEADIN